MGYFAGLSLICDVRPSKVSIFCFFLLMLSELLAGDEDEEDAVATLFMRTSGPASLRNLTK